MELYLPPVIKVKHQVLVKGPFSPWEFKFIMENYANMRNIDIAIKLNRPLNSIDNFRTRYKLKKSAEFLSDRDKMHKWKKGNKPWNKGLSYKPSNTTTQFKKGHVPANYKPVGYERINAEGYIDIKIADPNIFRQKHRVEWEKIYGPVPPNLILVCRTADKLNTDPSNWMAITRAEHVQRNHNTEKSSETMKALWRSEKIRVNKLGLPQKTKLRVK